MKLRKILIAYFLPVVVGAAFVLVAQSSGVSKEILQAIFIILIVIAAGLMFLPRG